ncbi:MAG: hypothetical protein WAU03_03690 [Candidatus Saccharimonas aalborgensis]
MKRHSSRSLMSNKKSHLARQCSTIEVDFSYYQQIIPVMIYCSAGTKTVTTWLFLGTAQVGRLAQWVAQSCPPGVAVIPGAPHWFANEDGSDIPEFIVRYTATMVDELTRRYGQPASIIAESQAAGGVAVYLQKVRDSVGQLILLQPLGLTTHEYTRSFAPYSELQHRVNHNFLHQIPSLFTDFRLLFNHAFLIRTIKPGTGKARAQYEAGLVCSILPSVKELFLDGTSIHIVSGEYDSLFPPDKIGSNLDAAGMRNIPIYIVPKTPHSPLSTRAGRRLLERAFMIANKELPFRKDH